MDYTSKRDPGEILDNFRLRHTNCRNEILEQFLGQDFALSHHSIEQKIDQRFDRVTIYRNLRVFLDKGVIHKVLDDEGVVKYALCKTACSHKHHNHEHVHFKCEKCGKTVCIEDLDIPNIQLPENFKAKELNMLIQGTCDECS